MAKRKKKPTFPKWLKKSPITGLILFFAWSLFQLVGDVHSEVPIKLPSSNEPAALYSNQTDDNLTRLHVNAIENAKHSITLVIYALLDEEVIGALRKKSEEGISIFLVCDAKASPGITKKIPKATCIRRIGDGLMHQKILIVDNKQILLGSANLTYSSLKTHGNLVVGLENEALAEKLSSRAKEMDEEGTLLPSLQQETQAGGQHVELWMLPNDPGAVNKMKALFRTAKKSIKVAMFTWTRRDFAEELIAASRRGVKVEVVLDRYSAKGAGAKISELLKKNGISTNLSTGQGLLHHKFACIDDSILINGSANWTKAAFENNDDYFLIIDPLSPEQQEKMNQLWKVIKKKSSATE